MEYMIPSAYDFFWVQENGYFSDLRNNILCRETESIFHTHTYVPLGGGGDSQAPCRGVRESIKNGY